jgi:hypothetical protein
MKRDRERNGLVAAAAAAAAAADVTNSRILRLL